MYVNSKNIVIITLCDTFIMIAKFNNGRWWATTIIVGASTAYGKTKTNQGKTERGWSYTFVGNYNSSTGAVSGSTKASFSKHEGCYVKLQAYVLNGRKYIDRTAYEENYVKAILMLEKIIVNSGYLMLLIVEKGQTLQ